MHPLLVLLIGAVIVGAWPVWTVVRRQRRARGTANDHLPGHRNNPGSTGADHGNVAGTIGHIDSIGGG